jgi:hypothetical protein
MQPGFSAIRSEKSPVLNGVRMIGMRGDDLISRHPNSAGSAACAVAANRSIEYVTECERDIPLSNGQVDPVNPY